jgi:hypothetical protein
MREEHPNQGELPGLPAGGPVSVSAPEPGSDQVREMSEVAVLQAKVLDLGLVREPRPVFVYDVKLAKEKSKNAERQDRHRKKLADSGLIFAAVPADVASAVKAAGGDWSAVLAAISAKPKIDEGAAAPTSSIGEGVEIAEAARVEILAAGGVDEWVKTKINAAISALPPVPLAPPAPLVSPQIIEKIVEKIIEKPVIKLTSEQKKSLAVGEKVQKMTGWRAALARKLMGI